MNNLQRLVNLIAIIVVVYYLLQLNQKVNEKYSRYVEYNQIVRSIARGEDLSESELQIVAKLAGSDVTAEQENTPLCLIKAYSALREQVGDKGLFSLFQSSQHEYQNVDNCLNYLSILLYRARSLQAEMHQKVVKLIEQMQKKEIERKYPIKKEDQKICVYFSTLNNEKTIKEQIAALNAQQYSNYHVEINDRGSTDNTHILASYTLQEMFAGKEQKIILKTNSTKNEGILAALKRVTGECQDNSIMLVIADDDTLIGSNVLQTVSRVFANEEIDIAVFSGLQTTHLNLEYPQGKDLLNVKAPILAYRKTALQSYNKLLKFEEQTNLQPFWRTWLANHLLFLEKSSNLKLKTINQALVFHSPSKNTTQIVDFESVSTLYNSLA